MKLCLSLLILLSSFQSVLWFQLDDDATASFEWQTASLGEFELSEQYIGDLEADWSSRFDGVTGIVVVYADHIIYEAYHQRQTQDSLMSVFSVTKSIGSILTGIAIADEFIEAVDEPISTYLPEYFIDIDDNETESITIENVLTMSTGLRSGWNLEGSPINAYRGDLFTRALDASQVNAPNTVSQYNTVVSNLMSGILSSATEQDLEDYAQAVLFEPIGIDTWAWYRDDNDYPTLGAGIELRTRDMARIGRLMLREGDWQGIQVVPQEWVTVSTQAHYQTDTWTNETHGYGYLWWVSNDIDYDNYIASGYGGQFIYVIPELDLVVAISSQCCTDPTSGWNARQIVDEYIIPMLEEQFD